MLIQNLIPNCVAKIHLFIPSNPEQTNYAKPWPMISQSTGKYLFSLLEGLAIGDIPFKDQIHEVENAYKVLLNPALPLPNHNFSQTIMLALFL